jgi:hypothetical protein
MPLVPTIAQMLTTIGVALLITIALTGLVAFLSARQERRTAVAQPAQPAGLHDDHMPQATAPVVPGQRPTVQAAQKVLTSTR